MLVSYFSFLKFLGTIYALIGQWQVSNVWRHHFYWSFIDVSGLVVMYFIPIPSTLKLLCSVCIETFFQWVYSPRAKLKWLKVTTAAMLVYLALLAEIPQNGKCFSISDAIVNGCHDVFPQVCKIVPPHLSIHKSLATCCFLAKVSRRLDQ